MTDLSDLDAAELRAEQALASKRRIQLYQNYNTDPQNEGPEDQEHENNPIERK
jgi:hypothetical protein